MWKKALFLKPLSLQCLGNLENIHESPNLLLLWTPRGSKRTALTCYNGDDLLPHAPHVPLCSRNLKFWFYIVSCWLPPFLQHALAPRTWASATLKIITILRSIGHVFYNKQNFCILTSLKFRMHLRIDGYNSHCQPGGNYSAIEQKPSIDSFWKTQEGTII